MLSRQLVTLAVVSFSLLPFIARNAATAGEQGSTTYPVSTLSGLAANMSWVGPAIDEPDYYVWCSSPILGPEGKVHLFCSRWPKKYGFDGWSSHCEIAHYVGDRPEGPFRFVDVSIPAVPDAPFNNAVHNPAIAKAGNQYVLLYISFDRSQNNKMLTCMAVSDSLDGPWKKVNDARPMIAPSADPSHWTHNPWAMDNPTFLEFQGKFYIFFKAAPVGQQFKSRYGYAVSDKLEGPYVVSDRPCTDNINYIEDATAFVWDGKICLLTTDNFGTHTGIEGAGILWKSDNPTQFRMADAQIGFLRPSEYWNLNMQVDLAKAAKLYTSNQVIKFERPGLLLLDGKPAYFYAACGTNFAGNDHTCSYVLKINLPSTDIKK